MKLPVTFCVASFASGILCYKKLLLSQTASNVNCRSLLSQSDPLNPEKFMAVPVTSYEELQSKCDSSMRHRMELLIMRTQRDFCRALEKHENEAEWRIDKWERKSGGGGISCVMQDGDVLEKAGVNISVVHGLLPPKAVESMKSRGKEIVKSPAPFFACGVSCVIHPKNPFVPTIHYNYRYFEVEDGKGNVLWWFGGGTDLTPYYLDEGDAVYFHDVLKHALSKHGKQYYKTFKRWCDTYFYLPHRGETRGIGGIFFDDLDEGSPDEMFELVKSCAEATVEMYEPILERHKNDGYGRRHREWQLLRRGRYVEFNLLYDRGTQFGLRTPDARIESILMSLPASAKWEYMHEVTPGSPEDKMMTVLKGPLDWVSLTDDDEKD